MGGQSELPIHSQLRKEPIMNDVAHAIGATERPAPIERGPPHGPFAVGQYAEKLSAKLRDFAPVQIFGELVNVRRSRVMLYFELRDRTGGLPGSMWLSDFFEQGIEVADGDQVVI